MGIEYPECVSGATVRGREGTGDEQRRDQPSVKANGMSRVTISSGLSELRGGHSVSNVTVARCLAEMGYTLQANVKTREGPRHPDRDAQFRCLNRQLKSFRRTGDPVISVDSKKKELVGASKNGAGGGCRKKAG